MITASDKALEKLQEWLAHKSFETGIGFRILTVTNEFGKPAYGIKLDKQRQGDEVTEFDGVRLLLDPASATEVTDYELDYLDELNGGFVLRQRGVNNG